MSPKQVSRQSELETIRKQQADLLARLQSLKAQEALESCAFTLSVQGTPFPVFPKIFSSGSTGYFAIGKIVIDGKKYQCQFQAVLVGSKPK